LSLNSRSMPLWADPAATHQFDTDSRFLIEIEKPPIQRSSEDGVILEIAYHLLSEQNTFRELGIDYFDRYRAER